MNETNTTTSLQGNEVPPPIDANGASSTFESTATSTTATSVNPRVKVLERKNGMIAGVAGGIADYFDIDVAVVRLILVGLAFLTFPALPLAYLVAWVIIPEEGKAPTTATPTTATPA